ncbi:chaperonin 10-like protein [Xylogone sp. PMI_703]|nr:chaperonin 10-like protein [Xylogone sp. PMI_703]
MAATNPAFILHSIGKADPWDVRVHIAQTGICGSDLHYYDHGRIGDFILTTPIILGHESSGTIVEIGSAVKNLKVGDRVAIEPGVPCRHCDYCRSGSYNLCPDTVFAATPPWEGTLAKYYIVAADYCYRIPDDLDMEQGALVEPVACAVQMVKVGSVRANQTVVSKIHGAKKVIGVDISKGRLDFTKSFGAADDIFFPPPKPADAVSDTEWSEKLAAMIKEQFNLGDGPDVVIEATGAPSCIATGVHLTKKGGTYVQAGMGKENVEFPITTVCIRDLTIRGSIRYTTGCYPTAIDLVAGGKIDVNRLITNRFKFEDAKEGFDVVRQKNENVIKVLIQGVQD